MLGFFVFLFFLLFLFLFPLHFPHCAINNYAHVWFLDYNFPTAFLLGNWALPLCAQQNRLFRMKKANDAEMIAIQWSFYWVCRCSFLAGWILSICSECIYNLTLTKSIIFSSLRLPLIEWLFRFSLAPCVSRYSLNMTFWALNYSVLCFHFTCCKFCDSIKVYVLAVFRTSVLVVVVVFYIYFVCQATCFVWRANGVDWNVKWFKSIERVSARAFFMMKWMNEWTNECRKKYMNEKERNKQRKIGKLIENSWYSYTAQEIYN